MGSVSRLVADVGAVPFGEGDEDGDGVVERGRVDGYLAVRSGGWNR